MHTRSTVLAVLVLLAASLIAEAGDTTLREVWRSDGYQPKPLPEVWRPKKVSPTIRDIAAFVGFHARSVSITNFVAVYGLPDRYLVTDKREKQDFLIYDFPNGSTAAVYVPKPPAEAFAAVVVIDRRGDLVKLIK